MKKIISILVCISMLFSYAVAAEINTVVYDTAEYVCKTVHSPSFGQSGGEWAVMGLARSGYEAGDEYFASYIQNVTEYVINHGGVLDERKYTEYARVILALAAAGGNPEDVGGYNLLAPLGDFERVTNQGINGVIWALIASDCGGYEMPARDMYINYILERQKSDGGWALSDSSQYSEADITAMALCAFSQYISRPEVAAATEKALSLLSQMQTENAGFKSYGEETAESCAQVITAMSALKIPFEDERFVKNNKTLLDNLQSFYVPSGGFKHTLSAGNSNLMATEQALCALAAADRFLNGKNSFYKMTDVKKLDLSADVTVGSIVNVPPVTKSVKTFEDISGRESKAAISALAQRGIINGQSENLFNPDSNMTRAEFATIIVNGLGIAPSDRQIFGDVKKDDWFYGYVAAAAESGIIKGITETRFNPNGTLTKQEAAVMVTRAAKLCGIKTDMELIAARDILSGFMDYVKASEWAFTSLAFCYESKILDGEDIEILPQREVTREEIAQMLYNMLKYARLI